MMGLKVQPFTDDDEAPSDGQPKIGAIFAPRATNVDEWMKSAQQPHTETPERA
jgi:hypothetical protein